MRGLFLLLLAGLVAFGADDDWSKVKALKTGSELKIYKKGSSQPVAATMDELTGENLVVVIKKTQTAIPKDQIDRIDARPGGGAKWTKETTTKDSIGSDGSATQSTSTGYSTSGRPNFETVFRRSTGAPK
jgi:hypothetical protein